MPFACVLHLSPSKGACPLVLIPPWFLHYVVESASLQLFPYGTMHAVLCCSLGPESKVNPLISYTSPNVISVAMLE